MARCLSANGVAVPLLGDPANCRRLRSCVGSHVPVCALRCGCSGGLSADLIQPPFISISAQWNPGMIVKALTATVNEPRLKMLWSTRWLGGVG